MATHPHPIRPACSRRLLLALPGLLLAGRAVSAATRADDVPAPRRTVPVRDADDLGQALSRARPGDHLVLEDGRYEGKFEIEAAGSEGAPIVLRSRRPLGATLTDSIVLNGADFVLLGLRLDSCKVKLVADRTRMSRCRQTDTDGIAVLVADGRDIVIDHNELSGMRGRGISLKPSPRAQDALRGVRIYRNYLHDFVGEPHENVHEGIQLGQGKNDTKISLQAVVEYNLLENVSIDPEAISIKSSDNIVRFNTFLNCDAFLSNRQGRRNRIVANWLERCRGIQVQDADNEVVGNVLRDCHGGIMIMGGNVTAEDWPRRGSHPAAANTLVAGNEADSVRVGYTFKGQDIPAIGTRLAGQNGDVERLDESDTERLPAVAAPKAVRLTARDVGPEAA